MTLWSCGTKPLVNPPSNLEEAIAKSERELPGVYLIEVEWREDAYKVDNTHPKSALKALQEMSIDFGQCYSRHTPLVQLLTEQ